MTLIDRPVARRRPHGGVPARRAVVRWAWRLSRREWRRQALLLALVGCTVAAAVVALAATHAYNPSAEGEFGSARQLLRLDDSAGSATLRAQLDAARARLAPADIITHRTVPIPGSVSTLDLRAQDPQGRYAAARLRLIDGRLPAAGSDTEIALTRTSAGDFHARTGGAVVLGGQRFTVVGLVENPARLADTSRWPHRAPTGTPSPGTPPPPPKC